MDAVNYSTFRTKLASLIDKVNDDHKPLLVTRQKGKPAVLISLEDFQAYEETSYLLSNPANARALMESMEQAEAGRTLQKGLDE